jgi:hypothetical protein
MGSQRSGASVTEGQKERARAAFGAKAKPAKKKAGSDQKPPAKASSEK